MHPNEKISKTSRKNIEGRNEIAEDYDLFINQRVDIDPYICD